MTEMQVCNYSYESAKSVDSVRILVEKIKSEGLFRPQKRKQLLNEFLMKGLLPAA